MFEKIRSAAAEEGELTNSFYMPLTNVGGHLHVSSTTQLWPLWGKHPQRQPNT